MLRIANTTDNNGLDDPKVRDTTLLDAYSQTVSSVAQSAGEAVVQVSVENRKKGQNGIGSGFIISSDGFVVTNHHIEPMTPASRSGLDKGDIIIGLGDDDVNSIDTLHLLLDAERIGKRVPLRVLRGNDIELIHLVPVELTG